MEKSELIWFDGELVPWDAAQVHVLTHTLHYGLGVFEGIRCYEGRGGQPAIFRLAEHIDRLFGSAHILGLAIPFSRAQITSACIETVRVNKLRSCYIRPIVFLGAGEMGLAAVHNPVRVAIVVWSWGAYLGEEGVRNGVRIKTASFQRMHVNTHMTKAKAVGNYVNSILAAVEARRAGYDEAMMLDVDGYVSECSGENIFIVRGGRVKTTPQTSILVGHHPGFRPHPAARPRRRHGRRALHARRGLPGGRGIHDRDGGGGDPGARDRRPPDRPGTTRPDHAGPAAALCRHHPRRGRRPCFVADTRQVRRTHGTAHFASHFG